MNALRDTHLVTAMPACSIQDEGNWLLRPRADLLSKSSQRNRKGVHIHGRQQEPTRFAALRMDKPIDIYPLIPWGHHRSHGRSLQCPNASQDRFETNTML